MWIRRLTLRNFKGVGEQAYDFTQFDLLVGPNNSGKSTILQALAIWQFCVDEFHRSKRVGSRGLQVVLPNFTALPVPEFNLLWKDRTERRYPMIGDKKKQEFILIEIEVAWTGQDGQNEKFGVQLRYQSPLTMYAIPMGGWEAFRKYDKPGAMPTVAYVPPFSGLEPAEKWLDVAPIRQQVGKGQPGSVLRNLLLKVLKDDTGWPELSTKIKDWFGITMNEPKYESEKDVYIKVEYNQNKNKYDIISGGSGFHQTLTLLAFLYGYRPTTILLDEPDAHLHVNLQRQILDYFAKKSTGTQFLIATHAEEFVRGVNIGQVMSLLSQRPSRVQNKLAVLRAMSDITNQEIARVISSPYILYIEGEDDERILRAWARACGAENALSKVCFKTMNGGNKKKMKEEAQAHFGALRQIIPAAKKLILLDRDTDEKAINPPQDNLGLAEWGRKNIENYMLVPAVWKRVVQDIFGNQPLLKIIDDFFEREGLTLPSGQTWRTITARTYSNADGKCMLFKDDDALYHQIQKHLAKNKFPAAQISREKIAYTMTADELHEDVHQFFAKVKAFTDTPDRVL